MTVPAPKLKEGIPSQGIIRDWKGLMDDLPTHLTLMFVLVTPEFAKALLKLNTKNRNPNKAAIASYAADMVNQLWGVTGACVCIGVRSDGSFVLLDGQNRLMAIVVSGEAVLLPLCCGLDEKMGSLMDIGQGRTTPQALVLNAEEGDPESLVGKTSAYTTATVQIYRNGVHIKIRSPGEWREWYSVLKPDVDWGVAKFSGLKKRKGQPASGLNNACVAGPMILAHRLWPAETEELANKLISLAGKADIIISPRDQARPISELIMAAAARPGGFGGGSKDRIHTIRTLCNGIIAYCTKRPVRKALVDTHEGVEYFVGRLREDKELRKLSELRERLAKAATSVIAEFGAAKGGLKTKAKKKAKLTEVK